MTQGPHIHLGNLIRTLADAHAEGDVEELRYWQGGKEQVLRFAAPAHYRADVNTIGGDEMYLQGSFRPTLVMECARCLREVEVPLNLKLGTLMRYEPSSEPPLWKRPKAAKKCWSLATPT
ncbi:hypothetical protein ACFP81_09790 [Deinococcus lacus]|uniref:DUF177 domain-containing protein n=1 Tax=Deinococcus lacus TaxID=392561 RepID=A0ABW1YD51_9DEIO